MKIIQTTSITFKLPEEQGLMIEFLVQNKDGEWQVCSVTSDYAIYARQNRWALEIPKVKEGE